MISINKSKPYRIGVVNLLHACQKWHVDQILMARTNVFILFISRNFFSFMTFSVNNNNFSYI